MSDAPLSSDVPPLAPSPPPPPARRLTRRFARLGQLPLPSYLLHMYGEMMVLAVIVAAIITGFDVPVRADLAGMDLKRLLILVVGVAPYVETLLCQSLFCGLARKLKLGFWPQVLFAWIPFFLAHFSVNLSTALCAGGVIGFYLSVTYVTQRAISWRRAFYSTWALHAVNNAVVVAVLYAFGDVGT